MNYNPNNEKKEFDQLNSRFYELRDKFMTDAFSEDKFRKADPDKYQK